MYLLQNNKAAGQEAAILSVASQTLQKQASGAKDKPLTDEVHAKLVTFLRNLPAQQIQQHGLQAYLQ